MPDLPDIAAGLLPWWDQNRAHWPWRETQDPYAIWVAEVMLQQTQVKTVIPYYQRWMERFPTMGSLAAASVDDVLKLWEGLGYYGRARNLHDAAGTVVREYGGQLPETVEGLMKLKGIGRYTAGAIASIAYDQPAPVVDGNVTRILSRLMDLEDDVTKTATKRLLWEIAGQITPTERPGAFNQALMELGQTICLPAFPKCHLCPFSAHCRSKQQGTKLDRPVRPPRRRSPHYDVTAGVIYGHDGRILIAKRPPNGLLGGLWEFPGGKQEEGESLPDALRREISEELGIIIEIGRSLLVVKHAYTHFRITLHVFEARHISGRPQHIGVADHNWVILPELRTYAFATTDRKIIEYLHRQATPEQQASDQS